MRVYSIYRSINGEICKEHQGSISTFIRLSGCNLFGTTPKGSRGCIWCDTKYAQSIKSGKNMSIDQIMEEVGKTKNRSVTLTGGEPLFQEQTPELINRLVEDNYQITVETNGSIRPLNSLIYHPEVCFVMDWKLPSSGQSNRMKIENFVFLKDKDWVKFVVANKTDFRVALSVIKDLKNRASFEAKFAFSPVVMSNELIGTKVSDLIDWLLEEGVDYAVVNIQLHKILNLRKRNAEGEV
jgi:7-carboxy-7-deazaguanine synthase